ncbi:hypothetical protein PRUPE_5G135100 [Prunus persica]|uniref:Uncharacterized protein n=1 Tax=Prunus persica TaxID=3760 RepID=A0A251P9F5_PRUPE|nr:uncharacterized protein LOC18776854 isoform X3 [Prunus persica]ONI07679.1 hypothetical protein PRUPE_5G135100 [Prunus persica]ONI07680.1 hypothetical protein PRUPE_5G135100 [Prunus persica]
MEGDVHGKRASSSVVQSRLSPAAQPFSLNPFSHQPSWSSLTSADPCASMLKPVSDINLEDDPFSTAPYSFLEFVEDSHFPQYPSANAASDLGFMPSASKESLTNYTELSSFGHSQASFSSNKNASLAYETLLEQGKPAVKGSKPNHENSESVHEKCSDLTIGTENQFISRSTDQVDAGFFSFSAVNTMATPHEFPMSVTSSTSRLQDYSQAQLPYTAPNVTWSHCNSEIALCDSGFTKLDALTAKSTVFHLPTNNSFPAVLLESDTSTTVSPLNLALSKNVDFKGNYPPNNYDSSSKCSPSGIKDLHDLISSEGKEIHHDGSPNDKGKGGKDGKPLSSEGIGALLKATSEPLITLTNIPDDFSLKHPGPKGAVSISKNLDENDSDLDSPCWKGTLASRQYGVSRSLSSDFVGNEQEVRNSLNPLAPQFFPRHAKAIVDYHANDYVGDDFSSFQKSESSAVNSSSKGHGPVDQAGSKSSSSIKGIGTQTSNDIHDLERVYPLLNNSESGSVLNLPEGLSKLLSTHSKLDVPTILNMMHDLSELLVQKCSNDLDSLNEHKHVMQNIINNLCTYIQHGDGGKVPISDITLTGTPYCPVKSTELHKVGCSNMGFQVTKKKALAVPQEINYQNDREGRKVNSHVFTERMLDSFPSCSGVGTEKSNDIVQVMGNALRDNHLTTEELDPQALVYKKLWLQAEAALCSMKYETCVLCMQLEMGGRKLDKNKVSGKLLTRDIH